MGRIIGFGETVEGYNIPVLNEREVRASAGMLFLAMFVSVMMVTFRADFTLLKYVIIMFLTDFLIRVFVNPRYAPTLILGRLIVWNQTPEHVGARQKKFAWEIGLGLAAIMFAHLVVVNAFSPITGIICLICLIFLFFESAFGICLGCKFYSVFFKEKVQYCPGEVCEAKSRRPIQKTSRAQLLIVLGFAAYIVLVVMAFSGTLSTTPYDMFGLTASAQAR
jgi:hypothetical protein